MKDWKTTISSIVGALAIIINMFFKLEIPQEPIIAITLFFIGFFAKDSTTTTNP